MEQRAEKYDVVIHQVNIFYTSINIWIKHSIVDVEQAISKVVSTSCNRLTIILYYVSVHMCKMLVT